MIKKILVATDGSDTAMKAAEYAVDLARQTGSTLLILSVIDRNLFVTKAMPGKATPTHLTEPIEDYLRQAAGAYLDEIKDMCRKRKVQGKALIRSGYPVGEILKEAEESNVDLVVIGSHGRTAIAASVLGSVAFGLIHRKSRIPVLVVRR
jgi:nucleotide-binding universal stress UspA family protein